MSGSKPIGDAPEIRLDEVGLAGAVPALVAAYEQGDHVVRSTSGAGDIVFVVGPEANRTVLTSSRTSFSHHAGWGMIFGDPPNMVSLDGEAHADARRTAWPAFTAKRMPSYLELIDETIQECIERWIDLAEVDVYEETRSLTFDLAARAFLGAQPGVELDTLRGYWLVDRHEQRPGARGAGEALLLQKIEERRGIPMDDALGLLARHIRPDGTPLTDAELLSHARFMLEAGYETSGSLGAWALYLLTLHPDFGDRVRAEVDARPLSNPPTLDELRGLEEIDRLLLETERLYPPVPYGPRGVVAEVDVEGVRLEPGPMVMYAIAAGHQLPSLWRDPDRFDPDRFAAPREEHKQHPYALVGFGGGPRRCMGMTFARLELANLVARVVAAYRIERVPGRTVAQSFGLTARPLGGMWLRAAPRFGVG